MTQEEKQLLLKDLCARLPYYTELYSNVADGNWTILTPVIISNLINSDKDLVIKPYLRPMSSMTEDEKKELSERYVWKINGSRIEIKYHSDGYWDDDIHCPTEEYLWLLDWLNVHHFDYRGLIPMGLAIEAPEDMYNKH